MARNMYGATSADFTLTSGGRVVPGAELTLWTARTGGTQITDLLDADSVACTTVTSDSTGAVVYYGPDGDKDVHWADAGQGARVAIRPVDITGEPPVFSIGTVTTGTAAASLSGTSEEPVLSLVLPSAGVNGVNTAAIQDDAVTAAKIAANAVGASELADSAVTPVKLARPIGNLLTDNQASGGDTLEDTTGYVAWQATLSRSTAWAAQGTGSILVTATTDHPVVDLCPGGTGGVPVTPGETYTVTVDTKAGTAVGRSGELYINFWDSGGTWLSNSFSGWTQSTTPRTVVHTAVAPAGAAYMSPALAGYTAVATETFYFDKAGLWRGAGGQWAVPGTPITNTGIRPNPSNTAEVQIWNDATATWITV